MKKTIASLVIAIFLASVLAVHAQTSTDLGPERILNFHSTIQVLPDSSMTVVEDIKVVAKNNTINHGIYRDFPTKYRDQNGYSYVVGFTVTQVQRDGSPEPYSVQDISNGTRVYIGDSHKVIAPGIYDYKISYKTNRQLGYFSDHDELYWNVTGNGWDYVIEKTSATVVLPVAISMSDVTTYGYTGVSGSKEGAYIAEKTSNGIEFNSTRVLQPNEGLTVVVGWSKGLVYEPTAAEKNQLFFSDNIGMAVAFLLLIGLFIYYFLTWRKVGRDPKAGTIIPQYESPQGLSPAGINFCSKMGYEKTALTAAIINMAVKGFLTITEAKGPFGFGKKYTLTMTKKTVTLSADEQAVADKIFKVGDSYEVSQENYVLMQDGESGLKKVLKESLGNLFVKNTKNIVMGVLFSVAVLAVGYMGIESTLGNNPTIIFLLVWLTIWSLGTFGLVRQVVKSFQSGGKLLGILLLVFSLPFIAAEIFVLILILASSSLPFSVLIAAIIAINMIFVPLMPRRTPEGRKLQDEIAGFKWFLSVTEKDRMNFNNPPEKTPQLFEKCLAYALALGVEQKWAEQFNEVFASLAQTGGQGYVPIWYIGQGFNSAAIGSFTSDLSSSFGRAISASSVPPGSSSGGGGGGSSGGGGGGGGGGGW